MSDHEHIPGHTSGSAERPARDVDSAVQFTRLDELAGRVSAEREQRQADHSAYTLRKAPGLRQVLIVLRPDGLLPHHHADGEVAVLVLSGEVAIDVQGAEYVLRHGDLLSIAPNLRHNLRGRQASTVLLTIAPGPRDARAAG